MPPHCWYRQRQESVGEGVEAIVGEGVRSSGLEEGDGVATNVGAGERKPVVGVLVLIGVAVGGVGAGVANVGSRVGMGVAVVGAIDVANVGTGVLRAGVGAGVQSVLLRSQDHSRPRWLTPVL